MPHYLLISYWVLDNQGVVMPNRVVNFADTEFFFCNVLRQHSHDMIVGGGGWSGSPGVSPGRA